MIRVSHSTLYTLAGVVWLCIGIMLLNLGLGFICQGFQGRLFFDEGYSPFFHWLSSLSSSFENAAIIMIAFSVLIGFVKGRMVLQKVALRSFNRIRTLDNPTSLFNLYSKSNLLVIAVMILLGLSMKYTGLWVDIRGMIDSAVGTALMQGALAYFHLARGVKAHG